MKKLNIGLMACVFLFALSACSDTDKTAGVTEDDNALALVSSSSLTETLSSSSQTLSSSSSVMVMPKFDLWNGSEQYQVKTGNENTGYWFSFADYVDGGSSNVDYPVPLGNEYSDGGLDAVIDYCGGMCGTIELESSSMAEPWAGVGFTVAEEGSSVDISAWGGVCVTYASDLAMSVELGVANDSLAEVLPYVTFPKTVKDSLSLGNISSDMIVTRCAKWSDFKAPATADSRQALSGEEAAKQVYAVLFRFTSTTVNHTTFVITGVSSYDENLPQWNAPVAYPEKEAKGTNKGTSKCLWKGSDGTFAVNTGLDMGEGAGFWYVYSDDDDGGKSGITWPVMFNPPYIEYDAIVSTCNGVCGKMNLSKGVASEAFVGVGFNVAGVDSSGQAIAADITDWGGICVTYTAGMDMELVLSALIDKRLPLKKSLQTVEKCYNWDDFNIASTKDVHAIKIEMRSTQDTAVDFNIVALGKYSANGVCTVGTLATSSSSGAVKPSSSSSVKSSSIYRNVEYIDTCGFHAVDDLWFGPSGIVPVKTGLDSGTETSGYWFKIQDRGSAENSKVVWPVELGDEYDDESFAPLVEYCLGVCATLDFKNAYFAGVGFHVSDVSPSGGITTADATEWGGLCVTYASDAVVDIVLNSGTYDEFFKPNLLPTASLPKSSLLQTKCVPWNGFKDYEGKEADVTNLSSVYFLVNGESRTSSKINIFGLGTYKELSMALGQCREKDVFVSVE